MLTDIYSIAMRSDSSLICDTINYLQLMWENYLKAIQVKIYDAK